MGRKLTTKKVIERIKEVHGDFYNYTKVDYKNRNTKVVVICEKHGEWKTTTEQLYRGQGCPECGLITQGEKRRLSQEDFITKCDEVHSDRYDYSKVDYQGMISKVIITCNQHGDFEQIPSSHLNGSGCPQCGLISQGEKRRLSIEEFIYRSREVHEDKYDYSKVDYLNTFSEVDIICSIHGVFPQQPQFHMNGSGCPKCSIIEQHEKQKKSTDDFIRDSIKVHGDLYDYSKVDLIDTKTEVIIICKKHGDFFQTPNNHQSGNGCPNCNSSKGELFISQYLKKNNIEFIQQQTFEGLEMKRKLKCDFYLPSYNLIIEYNGIQHYEPREQFGGEKGFKRVQKSDKLKREFCLKNNIRLLEIRYDEDVYEKLDLVFKI